VEPALEHHDRSRREPTEQQPADVTRRRSGGPAGQVAERDGDRLVKIVRESAETGAENDPDLGDEGSPGSNGGLESSEASGLIGRPDRPRWIEGDCRIGRNRRGRRGRRRTRI
jgi:hypothetical protein